jgi:hypothetical protein
VFQLPGCQAFAVVNLHGRTFMANLDNPFAIIQPEITRLRTKTNIILVDVHAEATSEKIALGRLLDSRVSAVIGTHTHVQTADERILPGGTAYISDVGMTGAFEGVIGGNKEASIARFYYQTPHKTDVAQDDVKINAVVVNIDLQTGKATGIKRIFEPAFKS